MTGPSAFLGLNQIRYMNLSMENEQDDNQTTNTVPTVRCTIEEYDGEGEWGTRLFTTVPQRGSVIELWTDGVDLLARVEDSRFVEYDEATGDGGDVLLFVKPLNK